MKKLLTLLTLAGLSAIPALARADEAEGTRANVFGKTAKYPAATIAAAMTTVARWLDRIGATDDLRQKVADLWKGDAKAEKVEGAEKSGAQLLVRLGQTFALVDAKAKQVVEVTAKSHDRKDLPSL